MFVEGPDFASTIITAMNGPAIKLANARPSDMVEMEDSPTSTAPLNNVPQSQASSPDDGGVTAWLQVLGCFFCWFNSWYNV